MVRVHPIPIQSNHRHRLRLRRHRTTQTLPCALRHRTQHATDPAGRDHRQSHRTVDDSSCTQLRYETRGGSSVSVLGSRRSRTIHPILDIGLMLIGQNEQDIGTLVLRRRCHRRVVCSVGHRLSSLCSPRCGFQRPKCQRSEFNANRRWRWSADLVAA